MIVPLKHVTLLCTPASRQEALARLADLGVLHVEHRLTDTEAILSARAVVDEAQSAIAVVKAAMDGDWRQLSFKTVPRAANSVPLVRKITDRAAQYLALREETRALEGEIRRFEPWGDFDPAAAARLTASGQEVTLFKALPNAELPEVEGALLHVLARDRAGVNGVLIGAPLPEGLIPMPMPPKRLSAMQSELDAKLRQMRQVAETLAAHEKDLRALQAQVRRGGETTEYVSVEENLVVEGPVAYITGYCDARKADELRAEAKRQGWGLALRDPEPGEDVPTLLEPPKLFRPILALFRGLGILPGYEETDVSVPFYIFFTLFFAMLVGDAGYGAIIVLLTHFARRSVAQKFRGPMPPAVRSIFTLFYVFGFATIAYGVMSGNYFAIPQKYIPEALRFQSIEWLADVNNIMQLCFTIGAVHLSIARLWNALVLFPSKKFLAELGWVGIIWCMYSVVCSIVVAGFAFPSWGAPVLAASILLVLLFMLDASELKTEGVNLGMLPLNVMSCMGDIISYVRLYAVGLASVKVAENFNMMATQFDLPMLIKLPVLALVLLFGHGLNFAMGALSILVHAVRLNTLEFSGAKGVSWSGRPFKPFTAPRSAAASRTSPRP
ncbi:MAG: V-type ATP synthase subunit I [Kiritimatiellia bacterium]|jgi:V/A-type H+-transporting ATPase subunit I